MFASIFWELLGLNTSSKSSIQKTNPSSGTYDKVLQLDVIFPDIKGFISPSPWLLVRTCQDMSGSTTFKSQLQGTYASDWSLVIVLCICNWHSIPQSLGFLKAVIALLSKLIAFDSPIMVSGACVMQTHAYSCFIYCFSAHPSVPSFIRLRKSSCVISHS